MRILLIDVWGLGDAVIMTAAIRSLLAGGHKVSVLCKPLSASLLQPSYPECGFITFNWPWTAFRGKYRLWEWPWRAITGVIKQLRHENFDAALSVRPDPRDHFIMFLSRIPKRIGYSRCGSGVLLTDVRALPDSIHRVEAWQHLIKQLLPGDAAIYSPHLNCQAYRGLHCLQNGNPAVNWVVFHCGAAQPIRRLPLHIYTSLISLIKERYDCRIAVIPDIDGYGTSLEDYGDTVLRELTIEELALNLAVAKAVFCVDSGPGHIAAAENVPVCSFFGPQEPALFRPYGERNLIVSAPPCQYRPCHDYCRYAEARCMNSITAADAWHSIRPWLDNIITAKVSS